MVKKEASVAKNEPPKRKRAQSDFPKHSLEHSLRVATALENANGGQPLPPLETATALGVSPGSSDFRVILSSSFKYGLTAGTYKSDRITLDTLGREIVEPKTPEERQRALTAAALHPSTFSAIYGYYKGKKLPEDSFLQNAITREFNVPREHSKSCAEIFTSNMDLVGLIRVTKSGRWLSTEAVGSERARSEDEDRGQGTDDGVASTGPQRDTDERPLGETEISTQRYQRSDSASRRVFITHGKNQTLVEPIKKLLGFGELVPVVSVERHSVSKPVPEKVMDDMRTCGAAIIHVDVEQTLLDEAANEHPMINPNVLIEIGAAMALFGRRFILLVRDGVTLPSNLQGLYEVRYRGDTLDGDATIRLLESINDIKKNPLPGSEK
jgi:hypothetical protein